eukprot:6491700-Amphidinium_carterae.3
MHGLAKSSFVSKDCYLSSSVQSKQFLLQKTVPSTKLCVTPEERSMLLPTIRQLAPHYSSDPPRVQSVQQQKHHELTDLNRRQSMA